MTLARALLVAGALACALPASAQTAGSETCTTITQSGMNAATARINADDTDIPQPQSVKNFTCLDKFFNGVGLNVVVNLLNPETLLNAVENQICNKLTQIWQSTIGKAQCGITVTGFKMGFLGGSDARRRPDLPQALDRRRRPDAHVDRGGREQQRQAHRDR